MAILIAGGSGFIGRHLSAALQLMGHEVMILSRTGGTITWQDVEREGLPNCEAVINLCGASVADHRWTPAYKKEILDSRVQTTKKLVEAMRLRPPRLFINASAVSYYPPSADQIYNEETKVRPSEGFLTQVAHQWEAAVEEIPGVRTAIVRIGIVLAKDGGVLSKLLPVFKWGFGGPIGTGYQPFPWIHIDDLINLFLMILMNAKASGPFNGVAPHCVTNGQFSIALGKALKRPTICHVPSWAAKLFLGERAELVLFGQDVLPTKSLDMGFKFAYATIESALEDLV